MRKAIFILCCITWFGLNKSEAQTAKSGLVVGYLRTQKWDYYDWRQIHYPSLTHIIHAFLEPVSSSDLTLQYNGAANSYDNVPLPAEKKNFEGFASELIPEAHRNGVKVILGLAGAANNLKAIFSSSQLRQGFIDQVIQKCKQLDYDGVDLDYEYPTSTGDGEGLKLFIYELYTAIHSDPVLKTKEFTITLACPKYDNYGKWFDFGFLSGYCDWYNIMTYSYEADFTSLAGHCSPLYAEPSAISAGRNVSIDQTIQEYYLTQRKVPKEKLVVGISFFGWVHQGTTQLYATKNSSVDKKYWNIEKDYLNATGWNVHWSATSKVPYLTSSSTNELLSYDNAESVKAKCDYALEKGVKGVMIWELSQGYLWYNQEPSQPLLKAVGEKMRPAVTGFHSIDETGFELAFRPDTRSLHFQVSKSSAVSIVLFDSAGRQVKTLVNRQHFSPGMQVLPVDLPGRKGLYLIKLTSNKKTSAIKILI